MRELVVISKMLKQAKDEINLIPLSGSLKQLIMAIILSLITFFEQLKKLMKKVEVKHNFSPQTLGHLIPLTVGHRD